MRGMDRYMCIGKGGSAERFPKQQSSDTLGRAVMNMSPCVVIDFKEQRVGFRGNHLDKSTKWVKSSKKLDFGEMYMAVGKWARLGPEAANDYSGKVFWGLCRMYAESRRR